MGSGEQEDKKLLLEYSAQYRYGEHAAARAPWALIIVTLIVVLFGGFWYVQEQKIRSMSATLRVLPKPTSPEPDDLDTLQQATINTTIPDFSKKF